MKTLRILIVGICVSISLLAGTSFANTISDTYVTAVIDPYKFETLLTNEVKVNADYYSNFFNCYDIATGVLQQSLAQLRQKLPYAKGQEYYEVQRQITEFQEFLRELGWLADVITSHQNGERNFYLNTQLAQSALLVISVAKQTSQDVRVLRRGRVTILESIACQ